MAPAVSPDGRYIVFESGRTGGPHIWRMDIDGSNPKQLTDQFDFHAQWSPDGQWIVYQSNANNRQAIRKVSFSGGQSTQLNDEGTFADTPALSPDGKQVACYYQTDPNGPAKLSIVPIAGGPPTKTFAAQVTGVHQTELRWTPDGRAIVYVVTRAGVSNLWAEPVDGSAAKQLTNFTTDLIFAFDFSRDAKQLALSRGTRTSDVILISDFKQ
jgi:TolB protein